jgi:hypothetical protein
MKKLKLQMEDLEVESFVTDGTAGTRGTVEGHNTLGGNTCGAEPPIYCSFGTDPIACAPDTLNCPTQTCLTGCGCATGSGFTCVGCTTHNYTADLGDDTCGICMSFGSDVPARCPCP